MSKALNRRNFMKAGAGALAAGALGPVARAVEEPSAVTNNLKKGAIKKEALQLHYGEHVNAPGSAATGSAAGPGAQASAIPGPLPKRDIKQAIMYATVPGKHSVLDKFKMIRDAGFEGVEPMGSMDRDEVMKARDAAGLQIPSVCDAVHWVKPLSDPNPSARAVGLEGLKTALQDCKTYGGSSVLLVPAVVNQEVSYADAYQRSQAEIREAIPLAEELNVKIAIENVWNYFLMSPLEAARYVDEFKSAAVGWHFDVGNIIAWGWPEQWIRVLAGRIQKLHIKEYSRTKRDNEGLWKGFQVEYLEGDNNWPAVMKALDEVGYRGWAIAEPAYHPPGLDDAAFLKNVREKMGRILEL